MIRERDDAVSTYVKTTEAPVIANAFVKQAYWDEVGRQVRHLIGGTRCNKLADLLEKNPVYHALFKKSEQTRVDLIIMLLRQRRLE